MCFSPFPQLLSQLHSLLVNIVVFKLALISRCCLFYIYILLLDCFLAALGILVLSPLLWKLITDGLLSRRELLPPLAHQLISSSRGRNEIKSKTTFLFAVLTLALGIAKLLALDPCIFLFFLLFQSWEELSVAQTMDKEAHSDMIYSPFSCSLTQGPSVNRDSAAAFFSTAGFIVPEPYLWEMPLWRPARSKLNQGIYCSCFHSCKWNCIPPEP